MKLAEGTGGLEFSGRGGAWGATIACWVADWIAGGLLLLGLPEFPSPELAQSPTRVMAIGLGIQVATAMVSLLIAWAVVPGTHVRRFSGLILASILIVGLRYAATVIVAQLAI